MTVNELILEAIERSEMTQAQVAKACGIPRQNLSPMLRGVKPLRPHHLAILVAILNLDLDCGTLLIPKGK